LLVKKKAECLSHGGHGGHDGIDGDVSILLSLIGIERSINGLEATKLVIEYCLEILDEVEGTISGKATLARLRTALKLQYAEQCENKVFQYQWAQHNNLWQQRFESPVNSPV
jgi:hypothetical protein